MPLEDEKHTTKDELTVMIRNCIKCKSNCSDASEQDKQHRKTSLEQQQETLDEK